MKTVLSSILASAVIMLAGCSSPFISENKMQSPKVMAEVQRPHTYIIQPSPINCYKVEGEVQRPGWIECSGEPETLQELIEKGGGVTEEAHIKKIRVIYSGIPHIYNLWHIRTQKAEDPIVPCGATIIVPKNIF